MQSQTAKSGRNATAGYLLVSDSSSSRVNKLADLNHHGVDANYFDLRLIAKSLFS